ncbi:sulfite exporter TauE/SafE family protein [Porcipelethomonas sp.]|uniref:sulfite exporter TauE/SafE family protein n=1 Tax=Porcipelethomonas sp. TaxID=2981675 RepID=UPI003EF1C659
MGKFYFYLLGIITGLANGLFGSGGGIIAVPMLKKSGLSTKESHATSIALTLPLSIVSSVFYFNIIKDIFSDTLMIIAVGLIGALLGGFFMKKIPSKYLKKAFGIILIISGIRLFFK